MAVILGTLTKSPLVTAPVPGLAESLSTPAVDVWPAGASKMSDLRPGLLTRAVVGAPIGAVLSAHIIEMFGGDLQQGVTFSPVVLNLGTVARETVFNFKMRNQFLVPISLTSIAPTNTDGLTLGFTAGLTLARTQERVLTLTAVPEGPEVISGVFQFTFDVGGTPYTVDLVVVGSRTQVWDFQTSWGDRVVATYSYRTDTFKPRSGRQQRRALRHNPRISLQFVSQVRRDAIRRVESILAARQNQLTSVIDPSSSMETSVFAALGTSRLTFATLPSWSNVGGLLALPAAGTPAIYEITAVGADYIDVAPELQIDYAAGTVAQAIYRGYLGGKIQASQPTSALISVSVLFNALPPTTKRTDPPAADVTFNGREVFLTRPNWGANPSVEYQFESTLIDYGRGTFDQLPDDLFPTRMTTWGFTCKGRTALAKMRAFHDRMYGARGEFYAPTWKPDFRPVGDLASGVSFFTAFGETVALELTGSTVFRHLIVMLNDGTHLIREVLDQTLDGSGNTLVFVDTPWPSLITAEQVIMICWLTCNSLGSDILTLTLLTDTIGTTTLAFVTTEDID